MGEHCKGINKPPHMAQGDSVCPASPAPKLGRLGKLSFTRNSSRILKKKMPLARRDRGCEWRARTSWEFAKEMLAFQRLVGLPFGPNTRPRFWGADSNITPPRALLLCISHPDGAAEAGEGRRTKAQPHPVSFLTLSACYTLCQVIFTPSKFEAVWCAVENTIKLNYSGTRSFPPPHLSSFLHLILEQRKITQRSIREEKNQKSSRAGVLDGTAAEQCPGGCRRFLHSPQPSSVPGDSQQNNLQWNICCVLQVRFFLGAGFHFPQGCRWDGFAGEL